MTLALDALILPAFDDLEGLPGEATPWYDRYDLSRTLSVRGLAEPLAHDGTVGVVPTGVGKVAAATTTTALCASDSLSLSETLILSVGVAGGPPELPIGSVVVADSILDWDDKCRFDDGTPPLSLNPYTDGQGVFVLESESVERARETASEVTLRDAERESSVQDSGQSGDLPRITGGVNVCGDELWHGKRMAQQVEWLTDKRNIGPYRATEMEDAGTAGALARFGLLGQYLSVRAISNYDRPTDGRPARESFFDPAFEAGFDPAVENAVKVADAIVQEQR